MRERNPAAHCPCLLAMQIVAEFSRHAPIERLACNHKFWEGFLSMEPLIQDLQTLLPASFSELHQGGCSYVGPPPPPPHPNPNPNPKPWPHP